MEDMSTFLGAMSPPQSPNSFGLIDSETADSCSSNPKDNGHESLSSA